jgi:hypothetical protein
MDKDKKGEKILIGIIVTIVAGVGFYAPTFVNQDYSRVDNTAAAAALLSNRPVAEGAMSPEAIVVSSAMIGVWRGASDQMFTREFREDGVVIDRYEGETPITTEGIWGAFTADMAPAGTRGLAEGVVYVQMTFGEASLYFAVAKAADTLELVYLDRGSQSNFTRE